MKWIALSVLLAAFLLTGGGIFIAEKLKLSWNGYHAVLGMIFLLAGLQILYYPVQFFNGPFWIIYAETCIVLLLFLAAAVRCWRETIRELWQPRTLWVLAAVLAFAVIFYFCGLDLEYSDSVMYLNYISQNIDIRHLNLFNLYTGKTGAEWDGLYLYQGYYHFVSAYVKLLNLPARLFHRGAVETLKASVWGMGLLYSMISSMFLVSMVRAFEIPKKWLRNLLLVFALGYWNLYYWKVAFAFYGNTWRSLFIMILMYCLWEWRRGTMEHGIRVLIPAIGFAGIACSSSFLFISFAVLVCLAADLLIAGRKGSLETMSIFILPLAVDACILLSRFSAAGVFLSVFFVLYYLFFRTPAVQRLLAAAEGFLIRFARPLFLVILPILCAGAALLIQIRHPDFLYGYSYFFNNHQNYDMVKDYFFVYSPWYDNLVNAVSWAGIVVLLFQKAKTPEAGYIRTTVLIMCLVFMDPLCTPAIAYTIASNVFYRSWEVLFNPFMGMIMILSLEKKLEFSRPLHALVPLLLSVSLAAVNILPWLGSRQASYGFYLEKGKDVDPLSKVEKEAAAGIDALKSAIEQDPDLSGQPVVISQAEGTRVYLPEVNQLITARDYYYPQTRINQVLYEIGRRHHPWEETVATPYADTCSLLQKYHVNFLLIRYWENPEFDEASSACSVTVYQNSQFRLRKVNSN
jgi:hypothetical protein